MKFINALVVKLVDTKDLKAVGFTLESVRGSLTQFKTNQNWLSFDLFELEVRQMKETKTDHELGTQQEHSQIAQTGAKKFKLKFTDYATEKYQASQVSQFR